MNFLKQIICSLVFILTSLSVFSQTTDSKPIDAGLNKRNQIGFDLPLGFSIVYNQRTQLSFASAFNYTRLSKSRKYAFEFGIRYTQLNYKTYVRYNTFVGPYAKDTSSVAIGFNSFFDIPINFKRRIKINDRSSFVFNFGIFYTTYITNYSQRKTYLTADNSLISQSTHRRNLSNDFKMGIDLGLGFNRKIKNDGELYFIAHLLNHRFGIFSNDDTYFFPNLSVGYRRGF